MWSCHDRVRLILSFGSLHFRALGMVHSSVIKFMSVYNPAPCTWVIQAATGHGWAWSYNYKQLLMLSTMSHLIISTSLSTSTSSSLSSSLYMGPTCNNLSRLSMTTRFLQAAPEPGQLVTVEHDHQVPTSSSWTWATCHGWARKRWLWAAGSARHLPPQIIAVNWTATICICIFLYLCFLKLKIIRSNYDKWILHD